MKINENLTHSAAEKRDDGMEMERMTIPIVSKKIFFERLFRTLAQMYPTEEAEWGLFRKEILQKYVGRTVCLFEHNDSYSKDTLQLVYVFERHIEEGDWSDEDEYEYVVQQGDNMKRLGYIGFRLFDYAVFGAVGDEKDFDVQAQLVASNNIDNDKNDFKGFGEIKMTMIDEEFNFRKTRGGHFRIGDGFFSEVLKRCQWFGRGAKKAENVISDCWGYRNGEATLGAFSLCFKNMTLLFENLTNAAATSRTTTEEDADNQIMNLSDYNSFMDKLYSVLSNKGFERILQKKNFSEKDIQSDQLEKFVYFREHETETSISQIRVDYFCDVPYESLLNMGREKHESQRPYQEGREGKNGYKFALELELEPVFDNDGEYTNATCKSCVMPIGFRLYAHVVMRHWNLVDGRREANKTSQGYETYPTKFDYRIIPIRNDKFKIASNKREPSNSEKFWLLGGDTFFNLLSMLNHLSGGFENGYFDERVFAPYCLYADGVRYDEYEKEPKRFRPLLMGGKKDIDRYIERAREEFMNKKAWLWKQGFIFTETQKLFQSLFSDFLNNKQTNPINENLTNVAATAQTTTEDEADAQILPTTAAHALNRIIETLGEMPNYKEIDDATYKMLLAQFGNNSFTFVEDYMTPKAERMGKKKNMCYYQVIRYDDRPQPLNPMIIILKPCFCEGLPCIMRIDITDGRNNSDSSKRTIIFEMRIACAKDIGWGSSVVWFRVDNGVIVQTPYEYSTETNYLNETILINFLQHLVVNYKRLVEYIVYNNIYKEKLFYLGSTKRMKKSEREEREKALAVLENKIKRKKLVSVNGGIGGACLLKSAFEKFVISV